MLTLYYSMVVVFLVALCHRLSGGSGGAYA